MDQAVGLDHFHGHRKRQCPFPVTAAHTAELQCQNGAKALASTKKAVANGIIKLLLGLVLKLIDIISKGLFNAGAILLHSFIKLHH